MTTALIERTTSDAELARAAGRGDVAAFEALYDRHHRALLSFARHMLGRVHDAEDVVQHTFLAADSAFRAGQVPESVRAWLYTVARNRCLSLLRARRAGQTLPDLSLPSSENLAEDVERRDDLRALLADLRMLPEDQRAALLLAELGALSHAEVAQVLDVRPRKVKALVYQARQALLAAAGARAIPCRSIREELAVATGSARRRRHLRDHLDRCDGCRAYADGVAGQRASIAAILPVVPTVALRDTVLACLGGGGAAAASGGASAGLGVIGAKLLAVAVLGGAAAGGGTVAVGQLDPPARDPAAVRSAEPPARAVPAAMTPAAPASTVAERAVPVDAPARPRAERRRSAAGGATPRRTKRAAAPAARERARGKPAAPPGLALGRTAQPGTDQQRTGGNGGGKPNAAAPKPQAPPRDPGPPAAKPTREQAAPPPGLARQPEPAAAAAAPPGQAKPDNLAPGRLKAK